MKVCKFGGTSLADADKIAMVCDIIQADPDRRIVIVSAPGKRNKKDIKVTDLLITCAEAKLAGEPANDELKAVINRFAEIQAELGLSPEILKVISDDLKKRLASDTGHKARFMDTMKAGGEDNCAKLMAAELKRRGVDARYVNPRDAGLLLSDEYGNAQILPESYKNLAALGRSKGVSVFPGFFGYTLDGSVVTFPRGGSDITGSILAAAVKADLYENFTDVDSVFAADPAIVPNAAPIKELSYREMRELSYAGFNVLHDEAIVPAVRAGIPICVKNTMKPDAPGTRIVPERDNVPGNVAGIASSEGFCTLYASKYLMNREIGFGRKLLQIFEEEILSYEHMPSGIDNLSIILREDSFDSQVEKHVLQRIKNELGTDSIEVERGLALVMIVGEGMRHTLGVAAKATKALSDAGVNIEMMNQGSSEISMMFGVKAEDRKKAVQSLYHAFF